MKLDDARKLADDFIAQEPLELAKDALWYESRFDDGWLLVSDRGGLAGAHHFIVTDDGRVHHDEGSLPPQWYAAKYSSLGDSIEIDVINEGITRSRSH